MSIKAVLIGCGGRGNLYAAALNRSADFDLAAVCDLDPAAMDAIDKKNAMTTRHYLDYRQMVQTERPDAAFICIWTRQHTEAVVFCAQAGVKNVLCEKPMAESPENMRKVADVAEKTGCVISYLHQRRFSNGNLYVRRLIDEGHFGRILRLDLMVNKHLLDCGTHTIDQAFSYLHETPVKWVLGALDNTDPYYIYGIPSEGVFCGTLMYENGLLCNLYCGYPDMPMPTGVRIFGTRGWADVEWEGNFKNWSFPATPDWRPANEGYYRDLNAKRLSPSPDDIAALVEHVADCIKNGRETEINWKRAYQSTQVIYAFYESVKKNRIIYLPLSESVKTNPYEDMVKENRFS